MSSEFAPIIGRLLVVDDNKVNRLLLAGRLQSEGHTVVCAENGREALEKLRAERFDLMLLDIEMPKMDGYQVLEHLVADPRLRQVPVIMTSAVDEIESVVKCIELGAEDYLTKPVNPVLLRARLNASLEKKRLRDQQRELIRRFATEEVADDLETSGFALGGKSVEASVMFVDIRSFTAMAESQSPAETIELLNAYYALTFEAVREQGGIINPIIGDGFMAIFGTPIPHDDHGERAVRSALEMMELIEAFSRDRVAQGKVPVKIGIGIASGKVIAGYTGTQRRATYTCVGDVVNLASRLEQHTKVLKQGILVDEATMRSLGDGIRTESQGMQPIRGKAEPVSVYSVPVKQPVPA